MSWKNTTICTFWIRMFSTECVDRIKNSVILNPKKQRFGNGIVDSAFWTWWWRLHSITYCEGTVNTCAANCSKWQVVYGMYAGSCMSHLLMFACTYETPRRGSCLNRVSRQNMSIQCVTIFFIIQKLKLQ